MLVGRALNPGTLNKNPNRVELSGRQKPVTQRDDWRNPGVAVTCRVFGLPKGSYVVPFWVCYGFLVRDYNIVPKKELHRRVFGLRFRVQGLGFKISGSAYLGICF